LPKDGKTKPEQKFNVWLLQRVQAFCLSVLLAIKNSETKLLNNKQYYLILCIYFSIPENDLIFLSSLEDLKDSLTGRLV